MSRSTAKSRPRPHALLTLCAGTACVLPLAQTASAQLIASDSYNYSPAGSPLDSYPGTGIGFSSDWYEQFGHWSVENGSLSYSDGTSSLITSGNRVRTSNAEARRNLAAGPLGNAPGTIWVSMLAQQTGGVAANSFGGLSLPTGLGTFIYMGKPYNRAHWGIDGGPGTTIRESSVLATEPALLVMRIDTRDGADDVYLWVNPPTLAAPPSTNSADVVALNYNDFQNINILLLHAGATNSSITMDMDEIRVGSSFREVVPIPAQAVQVPFVTMGGHDLHISGNFVFNTDSDPASVVSSAGDGLLADDGQFLLPIPYRVFHYRNITVDPGAVVTVQGRYPLIWVADGDIRIAGRIELSGAQGESGENGGLLDAQGDVAGAGGSGGSAGGGAFAAFGRTVVIEPSGQIITRGGDASAPALFAPRECGGDIECYARLGFIPGLGLGGAGGRANAGGLAGGRGGTSNAGGGGGDGGDGVDPGFFAKYGHGGGGGGGGGYNGDGGAGGAGRDPGAAGGDANDDECPVAQDGATGGVGGGPSYTRGLGGYGGTGVTGAQGGNGVDGNTATHCVGCHGGGGGGGGGSTNGGNGGVGGDGAKNGAGGGGGGGGDSCVPSIPAGIGRRGGTGGGTADDGDSGSDIPPPPPPSGGGKWNLGEGAPAAGGDIMLYASLSPVVIAGLLDSSGGSGYFSTARGGGGQISILGSPPIVSGTLRGSWIVLPYGVSNSMFDINGGAGGGGGGAGGAEKTHAPLCPADVDDGTGTGTPDGGVTIDDLLYYMSVFEAGDIRADVDDGTSTGTPDQGVTIDDLLYFLQRFEAGC